MTEWTLESGIAFCRGLETILIPLGYHCALGGSVLHQGHSTKDLDVFVYPHTKGQGIEEGELDAALAVYIGRKHQQLFCLRNSESCPRDDKTVYVGEMPDGKRIDFFFLS